MKSLKKVKKYRENPFLEKTIEEVKPIKKRKFLSTDDQRLNEQLINTETSEVVQNTFYKLEVVDESRFAKFYISNLANHYDLTASAQRVLNYILTILKPNKSDFYFDIEESLQYTKYKSERSIHNGLRELVFKEIIAKSYRTNFYFINPTVAFNGDRVAFVKLALKEKVNRGQHVPFNQMKIFGV